MAFQKCFQKENFIVNFHMVIIGSLRMVSLESDYNLLILILIEFSLQRTN